MKKSLKESIKAQYGEDLIEIIEAYESVKRACGCMPIQIQFDFHTNKCVARLVPKVQHKSCDRLSMPDIERLLLSGEWANLDERGKKFVNQ